MWVVYSYSRANLWAVCCLGDKRRMYLASSSCCAYGKHWSIFLLLWSSYVLCRNRADGGCGVSVKHHSYTLRSTQMCTTRASSLCDCCLIPQAACVFSKQNHSCCLTVVKWQVCEPKEVLLRLLLHVNTNLQPVDIRIIIVFVHIYVFSWNICNQPDYYFDNLLIAYIFSFSLVYGI